MKSSEAFSFLISSLLVTAVKCSSGQELSLSARRVPQTFVAQDKQGSVSSRNQVQLQKEEKI